MKTVAVIFGGKSAEHDVSIITAHIPIIDSLLATGQYEVCPIYITKQGEWYSDQAMNDLKFFKLPDYEAKLKSQKQIQLSFTGGFSISWSGIFSKSKKIDLVFPAMHGTYGEDGSLMGMLRMANVPFVGCDLTGSAVAMDKVLTKQVLSAEGIIVVPYIWFTKHQWQKDAGVIRARITQELKFPLFVKPVHLGSSIGITKAKDVDELENAIEVALHFDDKVLIENGIENLIEVTLPIMGNAELRTAEVEKPLNQTELFSFEDKYLSGGGKKSSGGVNNTYSEIPAKIGDELTHRVKETGKRVYQILGLSGISRVDFLIDSKSGTLYVNEVNTLPGSLYHHNWKQAGVSNIELVTGLVQLAEERFESQKNTSFAFTSDILKNVGGPKIQS